MADKQEENVPTWLSEAVRLSYWAYKQGIEAGVSESAAQGMEGMVYHTVLQQSAGTASVLNLFKDPLVA